MHGTQNIVLWFGVAMIATAAFALAGCGGTASDSAPAPQTVTVIEEASPQQPETVTVVEKTAPAEPELEEPADSGSIEVPDVVGSDHQLAQDTLQAAGLYSLDEEDATGQERLLLWDRNWIVVSQHPPAGTMVTADETILLSSKKID